MKFSELESIINDLMLEEAEKTPKASGLNLYNAMARLNKLLDSQGITEALKKVHLKVQFESNSCSRVDACIKVEALPEHPLQTIFTKRFIATLPVSIQVKKKKYGDHFKNIGLKWSLIGTEDKAFMDFDVLEYLVKTTNTIFERSVKFQAESTAKELRLQRWFLVHNTSEEEVRQIIQALDQNKKQSVAFCPDGQGFSTSEPAPNAKLHVVARAAARLLEIPCVAEMADVEQFRADVIWMEDALTKQAAETHIRIMCAPVAFQYAVNAMSQHKEDGSPKSERMIRDWDVIARNTMAQLLRTRWSVPTSELKDFNEYFSGEVAKRGKWLQFDPTQEEKFLLGTFSSPEELKEQAATGILKPGAVILDEENAKEGF